MDCQAALYEIPDSLAACDIEPDSSIRLKMSTRLSDWAESDLATSKEAAFTEDFSRVSGVRDSLVGLLCVTVMTVRILCSRISLS